MDDVCFLAPLGTIAIGLLAPYVAILAASAWAFFVEAHLLDGMSRGSRFNVTELQDSARRLLFIAKIQSLVSDACLIVLMVWLYRADKNLRAFGVEKLDYTPGWAVGWWFVPVLNLVRPYQVMREIWLASNPDFVGDRHDQWRKGPTGKFILIWWLATLVWICSAVAVGIYQCAWLLGGKFHAAWVLERGNVEHASESSLLQTGLDLAGIASCIMLCVVIWRIDNRQRAAHAKVERLIDAAA